MTSKMKTRVPSLIALLTTLAVTAVLAPAQAPAARFLGTVTAVNGTTLTVKTDAGEVHQVDVPSSASLKQIEPGAKDLNTAQTIEFGSIATGDRVLVKLDPNAPAGTSTALQVIAVKQADLAKKQEKERQEWQQQGVGGLVKSIDSGSGDIVITSGAGPAAKTITIHTTKSSVLKRYAPASVRFDEAKPAPIDSIHAGDQLRARGAKNAAGTEVTADEAISGTFRNVSGLIPSVDAAGSTISVKDLATKKQITVRITPETQLRKLDEQMATRLAAVLNGGAARGGAARPASAPAANAPAGSQAPPAGAGAPGGGQRMGPGGGGFDAQMLFSRAPLIKLTDLKKGDAVMVVATEDGSGVSAITLLAGVEPLLEAPAASQNLLNWSLSSGAPDAAQ
jgi:ABC-type amino acid transport substrate-binding protein